MCQRRKTWFIALIHSIWLLTHYTCSRWIFDSWRQKGSTKLQRSPARSLAHWCCKCWKCAMLPCHQSTRSNSRDYWVLHSLTEARKSTRAWKCLEKSIVSSKSTPCFITWRATESYLSTTGSTRLLARSFWLKNQSKSGIKFLCWALTCWQKLVDMSKSWCKLGELER